MTLSNDGERPTGRLSIKVPNSKINGAHIAWGELNITTDLVAHDLVFVGEVGISPMPLQSGTLSRSSFILDTPATVIDSFVLNHRIGATTVQFSNLRAQFTDGVGEIAAKSGD